MGNKNVILLRHHPMNVHFTNPFYVSQVEGDIAAFILRGRGIWFQDYLKR